MSNMAKTKTEVPQGSNNLSITIERIMKDFGRTRYKQYSREEFLKEVEGRIEAAELTSTGAVKVIAANLKRRIKRRKTIEEMLLDLNETLFSFFEGGK